MKKFQDDEGAYLAWIARHPAGFVVNSSRQPAAGYLVLHSAACKSISTRKQTNYTTHDYIKHCSIDVGELHQWARTLSGSLHACGLCKP